MTKSDEQLMREMDDALEDKESLEWEGDLVYGKCTVLDEVDGDS